MIAAAALLIATAILAQPFIALRLASPVAAKPPTPGEPTMSQEFQDAFAAFQNRVAADKAAAVAAAVADVQANQQSAIDAAKAEGAAAESAEDTAAVVAATDALAPPA